MDSIPADMKDADPFPFVKRAFETIALAKVATSAEEARAFGFPARRRFDLDECRSADRRREERSAGAGGEPDTFSRSSARIFWRWAVPALATLKLGVHLMKRAGYISDHDALIGEKLARILTGGDLNHRDARFTSSICSISSAKLSFR